MHKIKFIHNVMHTDFYPFTLQSFIYGSPQNLVKEELPVYALDVIFVSLSYLFYPFSRMHLTFSY